MLLAIVLSATGCGASWFSANTVAVYRVTTTTKDGSIVTKEITYDSSKNQQGMDVFVKEKDGQPTEVELHVDKSTTAESAIAAASAALAKMVDLLNTMIPLLAQAAKAGS
jgi:hypothetical protein